MRYANDSFGLSASDLAGFLGCRHRTALDMAVARGELSLPYVPPDPLLEALWQRGLAHEAQYVERLRASGGAIVDLRDGGLADRVAGTRQAMHDGADVIVQGALIDGPWMGYPDILQRVERRSALGSWSYEVADTKLSRETRAGTILQLSLYTSMLELAQGAAPEQFHVITPDPVAPRQSYRVDDYGAYVRLVRGQLLGAVAQDWQALAEDRYPEPVDLCAVCRWYRRCADKRRADDHLSLVAGISRLERRELQSRGIDTMTTLGAMPVPLGFVPRRGSAESYTRVRAQAHLQVGSRDRDTPLFDVLPVEPGKGLSRLPAPSAGDLFLDLEGDPFAAEGGREYLFGLVTANGSYRAQWAFSEGQEAEAFTWVMDQIAKAAADHPEMHVYHYAPYEPAAFKRLMGRHALHELQLDAMLRAGRFVDLYGVVRQGLRVGVERYSIKNLEPLYGYAREVPLAEANRALRVMELGLMTQSAHALPAAVHDVVMGYNKDDCVSTLRLRNWLEALRAQVEDGGSPIERPSLETGAASESVDDKARRVEELRARLLTGLPVSREDRDDKEQARWILAYLLDYHRREDKAAWWEYFRLRELPEEDLLEEREAVAGLEFVERVAYVGRKMIDRYRYPPQEMELTQGNEVKEQEGEAFGKVEAVDRVRCTIDILKGPSRNGVHPRAVFAHTFIPSAAMEAALLQIGHAVADGAETFGAAQSLLAMRPPQLVRQDGEETVDFAVRIGAALHDSVLPIQGPPGAGKTYCGSQMICALIQQGKRVGVTANSHQVIRNLLDAVAKQAQQAGAPVRLAHKISDDGGGGDPSSTIATFTSNDDARLALANGQANVMGGTAWLWARKDMAASVDVLFVDEAGQMALANVIAVSQAANSVVLLGDPQQLEQPRKGTHPDGVGISALEHVLAGHQTVPSDRGIFLAQTWRLAPALCAFTSELYYEQRLTSRPGLERQRLDGIDGLPASGLVRVALDHDGNRNWSNEEIDLVEELVHRCTQPGATWTDQHGELHHVRGQDILVVAPYNAQVTRLAERLASTGARVGTVDKFQGQEAPIVIYSMATSRPEDAPRGMEFLYSRHRLNVATSRARCVAVVVASARLFAPECQSPRQMQLANGLCRLAEMADGQLMGGE